MDHLRFLIVSWIPLLANNVKKKFSTLDNKSHKM